MLMECITLVDLLLIITIDEILRSTQLGHDVFFSYMFLDGLSVFYLEFSHLYSTLSLLFFLIVPMSSFCIKLMLVSPNKS